VVGVGEERWRGGGSGAPVLIWERGLIDARALLGGGPDCNMIMEGIETAGGPQAGAFLLTDHHQFNVLGFETLCRGGTGGQSPPPPATAPGSPPPCLPPQETLNTPVTTSSDAPTFFGPSVLVEPPHIAGQ
jgi:hypothetical protein